MNLAELCPRDVGSDPQAGIIELVRAILFRTNFVPVVRHLMGWRGLRHTVRSGEGWTAKLKDRSGIFGLRLDEIVPAEEWTCGRFILSYFPDPAEELVESCSVRAAGLTQREDYFSLIRNFLSETDFGSLFDIARLDVGVNWSKQAVWLGLESLSRQQVIARDGVRLMRNGQLVELVEPGGYDQDFPSYDVALSFYHVLAGSITFNLGEPPVGLSLKQAPGMQTLYGEDGHQWTRPGAFVRRIRLVLSYGETPRADTWLTEDGTHWEPGILWQQGDDLPREFRDALWWTAHSLPHRQSMDKTILGVDTRPPVFVLTGFLGSGKTSFLRNFIEYQVQRSRFVAVIQNEIGAVGLDGKVLDYSVTEIDEGCICCTLVGSLKPAVRRILSELQPDIIVVETTGLANPFNLLDDMAELADLIRFDSVITVVDAINAPRTLEDEPVAIEQVRGADVLLLNKQDLVDAAHLQEMTGRLRRVNPHAPIFTTTKGEIHPSLICEVDPHRERATSDPAGLGSLTRRPTHCDEGIWSHTIALSRPLTQADFCHRVELIPSAVFRAKGIVDLTDPCQTVLFQYVAGRYELSEFHSPGAGDRFLVFIGQAKDPEPIVGELDGLFSEASSGEKNWPRRRGALASHARDHARSHSGASPCG
jgi:G3E family GTPase